MGAKGHDTINVRSDVYRAFKDAYYARHGTLRGLNDAATQAIEKATNTLREAPLLVERPG